MLGLEKPDYWCPRVLGLSVGLAESRRAGILRGGSLDLLSDGLRIVQGCNSILRCRNSRKARSRRVGIQEP